MKSIAELDENFANKCNENEDIHFYNICEKPFKIYGVFKPEGESGYVRMSPDVAKGVNDNVANLVYHTSGGRIRFKTDSKYIVLKCVLPKIDIMMHMPPTGSAGFDLYEDGEFASVFMGIDFVDLARNGGKAEYETELNFGYNKMRDIVINFPLYNAVDEVYIGIESTAKLEEGNLYKHQKPVVFYGSSITQGACASRPGNAYANILSRRLDFDFINLGFSGGAKGEKAIAQYISTLDMSVFVYDYDHNAPDVKSLQDTHYDMYKIIRNAKPDIPVIMISRPSICGSDTVKRMEIIKESYDRAVLEGDKNVYFINGLDMYYSHDCKMMTVDGCHPNDFGFYCMAEKIEEIIRKILT